jgi:hypothetical protein
MDENHDESRKEKRRNRRNRNRRNGAQSDKKPAKNQKKPSPKVRFFPPEEPILDPMTMAVNTMSPTPLSQGLFMPHMLKPKFTISILGDSHPAMQMQAPIPA